MFVSNCTVGLDAGRVREMQETVEKDVKSLNRIVWHLLCECAEGVEVKENAEDLVKFLLKEENQSLFRRFHEGLLERTPSVYAKIVWKLIKVLTGVRQECGNLLNEKLFNSAADPRFFRLTLSSNWRSNPMKVEFEELPEKPSELWEFPADDGIEITNGSVRLNLEHFCKLKCCIGRIAQRSKGNRTIQIGLKTLVAFSQVCFAVFLEVSLESAMFNQLIAEKARITATAFECKVSLF